MYLSTQIEVLANRDVKIEKFNLGISSLPKWINWNYLLPTYLLLNYIIRSFFSHYIQYIIIFWEATLGTSELPSIERDICKYVNRMAPAKSATLIW